MDDCHAFHESRKMVKQETVSKRAWFVISTVILACFASFTLNQGCTVQKIENMGHQQLPALPRPATIPGNSDQAGDDWPMFRGALNHTGVVTTTPVQGTGPKWTFTDDIVTSSPAVSGGYVYISSSNDMVYCLNATTGARVWNFKTIGFLGGSSPAVGGGRLYVGSDDHKIYCLNATTGASVWNYTTSGAVYSSPAVAGGRMYVGSYDHKVYCLNATTGKLAWSYATGYFVSSSPAVVGGRVYVGSWDDSIYCLNATTGTLSWSYATNNSVSSSPAVANGRIYVGSEDNSIYCLNATTGKSVWNYTTGGAIYSSPAVAGGRVYVVSNDNKMYCLNAITGVQEWNYTTGYSGSTSPAVAGGRVYVGGWEMYCLNATSGIEEWNYSAGFFGIFSPAIAGGHVYTRNGYNYEVCLPLILIQPSITHQQSITYTVGTTGNTISWTITASSIGTGITKYTISLYNTEIYILQQVTTGSWTSGTPVTLNIDGLSAGYYEYIIVATDGLGGQVQDQVWVDVIGQIQSIPPRGQSGGQIALMMTVALVISIPVVTSIVSYKISEVLKKKRKNKGRGASLNVI